MRYLYSKMKELIEGITRTQRIRYLYKLIGNVADGMFREQYWAPIRKIFKILEKNDVEFGITSSEYQKDDEGFPVRKVWKLELPWEGKTIYGQITAAGAGSVKDPLDVYDVTVVFQ